MSITKSAIARTHLTVLENREAIPLEAGPEEMHKSAVMHASARKSDLVDAD